MENCISYSPLNSLELSFLSHHPRLSVRKRKENVLVRILSVKKIKVQLIRTQKHEINYLKFLKDNFSHNLKNWYKKSQSFIVPEAINFTEENSQKISITAQEFST